jgi:hypothetical protein
MSRKEFEKSLPGVAERIIEDQHPLGSITTDSFSESVRAQLAAIPLRE